MHWNHKPMSLVLLSISAAGLLVGCTRLEVQHHIADDPATRSGYAYMLDYTQYEIVLKRTLVACNGADAPTINIEASVSPHLVPDGEHVYVIDPQSMISAFKTSDISIDYKDGRLTSFNASTVDKTGEVIASAAVTAAKIATIAAGVPLPVSDEGAPFEFCSPATLANLNSLKTNKAPLAAVTTQLEIATAKLAVMSAQFTAKPTQKLRSAIATTTQAINNLQEQADQLNKTMTESQAWLTDSMTISWPQTSLVFEAGPSFPLPPATIDRWFEAHAIRAKFDADDRPSVQLVDARRYLRNGGGYDSNAARLGLTDAEFAKRYPRLDASIDIDHCPDTEACAQLKQLTADLRSEKYDRATSAAVSLHLLPQGSYGSPHPTPPSSSKKDGLRYRIPAAGWLYICEYPQRCMSAGADKPIAKTSTSIAQLGSIFDIPFSSPAFASGGISVTFDEQGRLLHAGLKRDNATALAIATAAGSVTDQATSLVKTQQNALQAKAQQQTALAKARKELADAEAALEKTPTDRLNEELALLEVQTKVDSARANLAPSRTKELTTELSLAKLEADLAETRARYVADPQADLTVIKEQYEAQTLVLNARKAALEAETAVLSAERALAAARTP